MSEMAATAAIFQIPKMDLENADGCVPSRGLALRFTHNSIKIILNFGPTGRARGSQMEPRGAREGAPAGAKRPQRPKVALWFQTARNTSKICT